jgi:hypothetical protein
MLIANMQQIETMYQTYIRRCTPAPQPPATYVWGGTQALHDPFSTSKPAAASTQLCTIHLQELLRTLHTSINRITGFQKDFLARVQALNSESSDLAPNLAPICAITRENLVNMTLELEADVAGRFRDGGQDWKWEELKEQIADLVMRQPTHGIMLVERWGLKIQVV